MKIAIILGTRPEIIKMSPIIRECQKRNLNFFMLHSGQHYSPEMDEIFFKELELPQPTYNLEINKEIHYRLQISKMTKKIEGALNKEKPDVVLIEGDTNTVLAGALAAKNARIKVGHIEAGLRSNDLRMLEEINRIIVDNISDFLFAPTKDAQKNLKEENLPQNKIFLTGNTIVDAVLQNLDLANQKSVVLNKLRLKKDSYILATVHRAENVDDYKILSEILRGMSLVQKYLNLPLICPIHHRTKLRIKEFNLNVPKKITLIDPLGFLEFLQLEANAKLILTDSGGVQEEACILRIPCVTMRISTERPETVEIGANIIAGTNSNKILESSIKMMKTDKGWENPFGDGKTGERIINILMEKEL